MQRIKNTIKSQKGVTLIELIVVLSVLTLVMGTTVSIFLSILQNQKRVLREQELFSQVSYAADYVSNLLEGAKQDEGGSCLGSGYDGYNYRLTNFDSGTNFYQGIKFISKDDDCQEFFLDTDGFLKEKKGSNSAQKILSESFQVIYARFIINGDTTLIGSSVEDLIQPRVTFVLNVKTNGQGGSQEKIIQTTVSQRNLNIQ